ncbi:hypothetical protein [[Phormidium] sp. ETS-05]|uniref:hypothetical protein n=1 Tax=[Phormidium] sp. ETS-05 TaxID=222819 RepID=UPI0018EEF50A|nr:hypothetical protein [[Phormidium] sp. ETS-05]
MHASPPIHQNDITPVHARAIGLKAWRWDKIKAANEIREYRHELLWVRRQSHA